ncbi:BZ3500_MvSof-1268-A1-R1_Chr4-2g07057 [Microbotryum saponariae]|uniref:Acyl-protein thioesterase 1 n=1 Tax=Microbotryum saponariae TaxID=289078 RepID=A0A2X0KTG9_9BASI|nr:BZ3500_MvSof-1268-A1-R1_Chr4-2g07057 [Microbotryum saponariae]SDA06722.1 BZ3501_MvSof-1269-A2-R1_Chr4-2g06768 [Microbotryum saponariae]
MTPPPPFTGKTPLVVPAQNKHTATLIFSHGLGDTADGWLDFAKDLAPQFPHVKWILTNAHDVFLALDHGDTSSFGTSRCPLVRNAPPQDEDSPGMLQSVETIKQLIEIEVANGIDPGRIVVGGFSQVLSILTTVTSTRPLAGTLALSGYLALTYENRINLLATDVGRNIPMLMAHGDQDAVIAYVLREQIFHLFGEEGRSGDDDSPPGSHLTCHFRDPIRQICSSSSPNSISLDKSQRGYDHLKSIGFDKINYRVYKGEHSPVSTASLGESRSSAPASEQNADSDKKKILRQLDRSRAFFGSARDIRHCRIFEQGYSLAMVSQVAILRSEFTNF